MTSARFVIPPGSKKAPNARAAAPFGSKSESCSMVTPSFSLNAFCDHDASVETP
jgi:hypothetical protein